MTHSNDSSDANELNDYDDINQDLIELERSFWNSADDAGFYERNMAADGRCLFPMGILDRDETVEAIAREAPWKSYEFHDVRVHELGLEGAVVGYRVTARRDGDDEPYRAVVATTYRRDGDRWELVLHQQTPLTVED